ncbi:MAG: hypothetical protein LQ342_004363 [Letrouitia transgressa]|nr:MAG: hypothetical protein LQ342_004363 [Letrouitia transgressa]
MTSVGKLSASLLQGTQDTTLALASVNFDFSLIKYEAPVEFQGLGASLSNKRKQEAEDGSLHIVARKLGALFDDEVPEVPHLVQAYGKRTTEIAEMPAVNPKGTKSDGAFADSVGADGTTIWAAATSGGSVVTVHLLACMLARIWSRSEAVSIWDELVFRRKDHLTKDINTSASFRTSAIAASRIHLTRDQLADWDAGARAWLRTADEAKRVQQTQLRLVLDNISLSVSKESDVYKSVMRTWTRALSTFENVILGQPQRIQDGGVLLALSSWHIYPDLCVFGEASHEIAQNDPLVGPGGIVSLGLKSGKEESDGVWWSLPLAHRRFYGEPVVSTGYSGIGQAQVTFNQLLCVALGAVFRSWDVSNRDIEMCLKFIMLLSESVEKFLTNRITAIAPTPLVHGLDGVEWLHCLSLEFLQQMIEQEYLSLPTLTETFWNETILQSHVEREKHAIITNRDGRLQREYGYLIKENAYFKSLQILAVASHIYDRLPGARVNLQVTSKSLSSWKWAQQLKTKAVGEDKQPTPKGMFRTYIGYDSKSTWLSETLSCIACLETGYMDIPPSKLNSSFAISHENSIFVARQLLSDPSDDLSNFPVKRIIGNIGKPGLAVLVSPQNPKMLAVDYGKWNIITHCPFDGKLEDNFSSTSLHLSLTGYEMPLDLDHYGSRDRDGIILEAAISVYERGNWIADLDVIKAHESWHHESPHCSHTEDIRTDISVLSSLTCVDSWIELLDRPFEECIVRARGNSSARLAAATIAAQKEYKFCVVPNECCLKCEFARDWQDEECMSARISSPEPIDRKKKRSLSVASSSSNDISDEGNIRVTISPTDSDNSMSAGFDSDYETSVPQKEIRKAPKDSKTMFIY